MAPTTQSPHLTHLAAQSPQLNCYTPTAAAAGCQGCQGGHAPRGGCAAAAGARHRGELGRAGRGRLWTERNHPDGATNLLRDPANAGACCWLLLLSTEAVDAHHAAASAQPHAHTLPAQEIAALHEQLRTLEAAHAAVEQQAAQQAQQLEQQTALATADSQAQQEWLGVVKQVGWAGGRVRLLTILRNAAASTVMMRSPDSYPKSTPWCPNNRCLLTRLLRPLARTSCCRNYWLPRTSWPR